MFEERWVTLFIFITGFGVLLRAPALTALGVLGLCIITATNLFRRRALHRVGYERRFNETRLFVGEILQVTCHVTNEGRLPVVSLLIDDNAPKGFWAVDSDDPYDSESHATLSQYWSLKPGEHSSRVFGLRAMKRGYFVYDTARLRAFDVLGLSLSERVDLLRDTVLVYPQVFPLEALGVPTHDPFGAFSALRRLVEDPARIMGARDYRYGDPFRQIHWKATAHAGTLQTRVCDHTSEPTAVILLNVATLEHDWQGSDVDRFEWALSVAGSLAVWAHNSGCTIGLSSNGTAPSMPEVLRVRPRRAPNQLTLVMESLAVMRSFSASPFEIFLLTEQRFLPLGTTLIVVTALVTPRIEMALRRLHDVGKSIILVSVDHTPPECPDMPFSTYHLPPRLLQSDSGNKVNAMAASPGGSHPITVRLT